MFCFVSRLVSTLLYIMGRFPLQLLYLPAGGGHEQNWLQDDRFCNFMFTFANNLKNKPKYYRYMRVLLINGSPKDHGNTSIALTEVANTLNEEGMQTMRTLGRNMAWMIKRLNVEENGHPEKEQAVWTNFIR